MNQPKRIFIIGHSGAGKGVLAQAIAKTLNWKFINADIFGCTAHIGRTATEAIGESGEKNLNHCLGEILSYQITQDHIVVTTDEQIVCDEKNRKLLASQFTVYLKVSAVTQLKRLSNYRPLLPVDNFYSFLDQLHQERDQLYEQVATFSLSSDNGDIKTDAQLVIQHLNSS